MHSASASSQPSGFARVAAVVDTLGAGGLYRDPLLRVEVVLSELERELLRCWWVRRLGLVAHAGAAALCTTQTYSRLEHSLGVLALVAHFAPGDRLARAAALVHDVGHTAFSHTLEGVAGVDHHELGAARVGELDALLRRHGLDAASVLDVVEGRAPSPLSGGGALGLDHVESLLRSGAAHGRTRQMASATLERLRLVGGAVDTDADTAAYLVELIAGEAAAQTSPVNLTVTAVLRHLVDRVLDGATQSRRAQVAAMGDGEVLALLAGDRRTAADVRLLVVDPGAWTVEPAAQGDGAGVEGGGSIGIEVRRLYLALPLVDGQAMSADQHALAVLAPTPARFTVRRREHR